MLKKEPITSTMAVRCILLLTANTFRRSFDNRGTEPEIQPGSKQMPYVSEIEAVVPEVVPLMKMLHQLENTRPLAIGVE